MKFYRKIFKNTPHSCRNRQHSEYYAEWVITESIETHTFMYPVDTWYLPDFERILLGIMDYVEQPASWKSLTRWTLYLGHEIHFFVVYVYLLFLTSRSLLLSWQWHCWTAEQILTVYNWGVYIEDIESNLDLDEANVVFFYAYPFTLNNENSPLLMWDLVVSSIFFTYKWDKHKAQLLKNRFIIFLGDSFVLKFCRVPFKVSYDKILSYFNFNTVFINICNFWKKITVNNDFGCDNKFSLKKNLLSFSTLHITDIFKKKILNFFNNNASKKMGIFLNKPIVYNNNSVTNSTASLLRKQKVFTKSKYARSRQYCKNIVFMGLLLNIILVFGLNSAYYSILINAGYFILPVYVIMFIYSIYVFFKFKLFNVFTK